jgi:hypothetical protein
VLRTCADTLEPALLTFSNNTPIADVDNREFYRCAGPGVYIGLSADYEGTGIQGKRLRHVLLVKEGAW